MSTDTATSEGPSERDPGESTSKEGLSQDIVEDSNLADNGNSNGNDESTIVLGILFWVAIGAVIAFVNDNSRKFIFDHWLPILAAMVLFGAILAIKPIRHWIKRQGSVTRAGLFTYVVLPLLLGIVGIVIILPERQQPTALRVEFLIVLCLLPATMWYLFIATRKASLLNEFLSTLDRLGLLARDPTVGDDPSRDLRTESYLQKFEALYGTLSDSIHDDIRAGKFNVYSTEATRSTTTLMTATVPVMISTVLIVLGWLITLPPLSSPTSGDSVWERAFQPTATPVTLAFLGAYFFSVQMLFYRYVLKDLRGSAYVAVAMRIILAVIGIWVIMELNGALKIGTQALLVTAFVIGVFPRVVWQIVQTTFRKLTRWVVPSMMSELPVSDLDGLTVWHETRLEEEDIQNVPNMATADLVDLLLNTRFSAERITDWMDQAILYTYLGVRPKKSIESGPDAREKLRRYGIRTATSLLEAAASADKRNQRSEFNKILIDGDGASIMPSMEAALSTSSNLELIRRWRGMSEENGPPNQRMQALTRRRG